MDPNGWLNQTNLALATVFATFVGPIAAVLMTRYVDHRRERYARRLDVFRLLMRFRRTALAPEFIHGLNLIDVEFYDDDMVLQKWKNLLDFYNRPIPADAAAHVRLGEERNRLVAELLDRIAKSLGISIPQLDIFHGGYWPVGLAEVENEQNAIRRLMADVSRGDRGFPVELRPAPQQPQQQPRQG